MTGITVMAVVSFAAAVATSAEVVECEGRCEDGFGNVMVVQASCDRVAERCLAGCDTSGARPEPYAECEPTGRAPAPPTLPAGSPGGLRTRDGD